jgi:hypothetical protein
MNWPRIVAITIGTGLLSSLTDWFFAGDWIHRRYTYPEIWRQGSEGRAIALSSPLPFLIPDGSFLQRLRCSVSAQSCQPRH